MSMFAKSLVAAWTLFLSFVLLLVLAPKLAGRIPQLQFVRPYLVILLLVTLAYGTARLYRQGTNPARKDPPDGAGRSS
jgi:hypothetical protein